jgi:hypothetical protein
LVRRGGPGHARRRARRRCGSAPDNLFPRGCEGEVVRALGELVGRLGLEIRSTRRVRSPRSVPASRYQISSLSTSPHGSTSRSVRCRALLV